MIMVRILLNRAYQLDMLGDNMPIDILPIKLCGSSKGESFRYDLSHSDIDHEGFPKHLLGSTIEEAEGLFKSFSKILNDIARAYASRSGLDKADIFGEAVIGLAKAKRDYDSSRSDDFRTFALYKITDSVNDYVRRFLGQVNAPAYIRRSARWVIELKDILKSKGLPACCISTITEMDMDGTAGERGSELLNYISKEARRLNISVDELVERTEQLPKHQLETTLDGQSECSEEQLHAKIVVDKMKKYLTKNELYIVDGIMEGKTHKEIAESLGYTTPWVTQRLEKIRRRLKDKIEY